MRVYAIRTGSYSDTSWGPVFSTVEKAIAYRDKVNGNIRERYDSAEIEVHVLDDLTDTKNYPVFLIVFDKSGEVISHTNEGDELFEPLLEPSRIEVKVPPPNTHWYYLDGTGIRNQATLVVRYITAPDLKHAVKVASDIRAQWLVEHS